MGKRGPAPKPTALRILHGDRKDRINTEEPVPRDGELEPPEGMSAIALDVWHYTLAEMGTMRIAKPADRDALVAYCEAVAQHRRASELLAHSEILIKGQKGNVVRNPAVQMQRDAAMTIKAFAAEFGLTPRARAEFTAPRRSPDAGDPERLLS